MNTEKWFGSYGSSGNNNGDADCNEMDVKRGGREMNVQVPNLKDKAVGLLTMKEKENILFRLTG